MVLEKPHKFLQFGFIQIGDNPIRRVRLDPVEDVITLAHHRRGAPVLAEQLLDRLEQHVVLAARVGDQLGVHHVAGLAQHRQHLGQRLG